jgi:hypothetical protein
MSRFKMPPKRNTYHNAKAKFAAYAASQGFPSAIDFVVARVAAGKNLTSLWTEIGAATYTSRRQFDNICRHLSEDAIARIDAVRTRRFGGNRLGKRSLVANARHDRQCTNYLAAGSGSA